MRENGVKQVRHKLRQRFRRASIELNALEAADILIICNNVPSLPPRPLSMHQVDGGDDAAANNLVRQSFSTVAVVDVEDTSPTEGPRNNVLVGNRLPFTSNGNHTREQNHGGRLSTGSSLGYMNPGFRFGDSSQRHDHENGNHVVNVHPSESEGRRHSYENMTVTSTSNNTHSRINIQQMYSSQPPLTEQNSNSGHSYVNCTPQTSATIFSTEKNADDSELTDHRSAEGMPPRTRATTSPVFISSGETPAAATKSGYVNVIPGQAALRLSQQTAVSTSTGNRPRPTESSINNHTYVNVTKLSSMIQPNPGALELMDDTSMNSSLVPPRTIPRKGFVFRIRGDQKSLMLPLPPRTTTTHLPGGCTTPPSTGMAISPNDVQTTKCEELEAHLTFESDSSAQVSPKIVSLPEHETHLTFESTSSAQVQVSPRSNPPTELETHSTFEPTSSARVSLESVSPTELETSSTHASGSSAQVSPVSVSPTELETHPTLECNSSAQVHLKEAESSADIVEGLPVNNSSSITSDGEDCRVTQEELDEHGAEATLDNSGEETVESLDEWPPVIPQHSELMYIMSNHNSEKLDISSSSSDNINMVPNRSYVKSLSTDV